MRQTKKGHNGNVRQRPVSYPHTLDLLSGRHLGGLAVRRTELQALIIPALGTEFVQRSLLLAVQGGPVLAAAVS